MEKNTKETKEKISFFTRLKIAIFKLENYGMFLTEKLGTAFKYFFLLLLIVSVIISLVVTYKFVQVMNRGYSYIYDEMPDFTFKDGVLNSTYTEGYDWDYNFRLIIDTDSNISEETLKSYREKNYDNNYGLILLNSKLLILMDGTENEFTYKEIADAYGITESNRQDLIAFMQNNVNDSLFGMVFIGYTLMYYINTVILTLSHVCLLAILGYLIARLFLKPRLKMVPMISLAIYSLTLSTIISCIYSCVNILTGFNIGMFDQIYYLIAVVYMVAAIFMIKYDLIKQTEELAKIYEAHEETLKELEKDDNTENNDKSKENKNKNKKDNKEDKEDKEDKKDDSNEEEDLENKEPDGSEI